MIDEYDTPALGMVDNGMYDDDGVWMYNDCVSTPVNGRLASPWWNW